MNVVFKTRNLVFKMMNIAGVAGLDEGRHKRHGLVAVGGQFSMEES